LQGRGAITAKSMGGKAVSPSVGLIAVLHAYIAEFEKFS
jgi:hypothetical protein